MRQSRYPQVQGSLLPLAEPHATQQLPSPFPPQSRPPAPLPQPPQPSMMQARPALHLLGAAQQPGPPPPAHYPRLEDSFSPLLLPQGQGECT